MQPLSIIEYLNVVEQGSFRLFPGFKVAAIDAFCLERVEEALHGGRYTSSFPCGSWRLLCGGVYAANATIVSILINDLSIELEGDLDLHSFLGLKPGHAGFSNISAKVKLDSDASTEALQKLHDKVINSSPVGHTLK